MEFNLNHYRELARAISFVENEVEGFQEFLAGLEIHHNTPIIGFTGAPGAGKSTLINSLIQLLVSKDKKVAVIAVDPTSPFNYGSLLGDRIRMAGHFNNPNVFIRSLATRGSLGGLSAKSIEICDVLRASHFDYILVETVGVGQSEVEIAGLADISVLVLVPEGGDDIQSLKSGVMEIADIFVVNKSDRPGSSTFINNLRKLLPERSHQFGEVPIVSTVASKEEGIESLFQAIDDLINKNINDNEKKSFLLRDKALQIISKKRMKDIHPKELQREIKLKLDTGNNFNLYHFLTPYL